MGIEVDGKKLQKVLVRNSHPDDTFLAEALDAPPCLSAHPRKVLGCKEAYLLNILGITPLGSSQSLDSHRPFTQLPSSNIRETTASNHAAIHGKSTRFDLVAGRNLSRVARKLPHYTASVALVIIWDFTVPKKLANDIALLPQRFLDIGEQATHLAQRIECNLGTPIEKLRG